MVTTISGLEKLCKVRFPSPQRGRGVRGERARNQQDVFASIPRPASRAVFRELIQQKAIPPHPQPLSRVGARGADSKNVDRIRTKHAQASL